ncbi:hypothetical protein ABKN59_010359 [Abortiporus biennis]
MATPTPSQGLFAPLKSKSTTISQVSSFLTSALSFVQDEFEPQTLQWFSLHSPASSSSQAFWIFDTSASQEGVQAHLNGKAAEALIANKETLFDDIQIKQINILASKVGLKTQDSGKVKKGLIVLFKAKDGKESELAEFLKGPAIPLIEAEEFTPIWYALNFGSSGAPKEFAIVDFFFDDEGRQSHLKGKVAEALIASAPELLDGGLDITEVDILAVKVK